MFPKQFIIAVLAVALVTMACGIQVQTQLKTGETVTDPISIPYPDDADTPELTLNFGAGELSLKPGDGEDFVSGEATYNVPDFKPKTKVNGSDVLLEQGDLTVNGVPNFEDDIKNEWDLELGSQPMELYVKAGAYQGRFDLGGLSLTRLDISDGAADVKISFDDPNPVEMGVLIYNTGASNVTLEKLGNANLVEMTFRSGAGNYRLDFSGELQRDAEVHIESGISSVVIVIPEGVSAELTFEGGMSNIDLYGGWEKSGGKYVQSGDGPTITLIVTMGAGNLELRNR